MESSLKSSTLFPIKAHYFLYYSGTSGILLFLPTYARQLGFSSILVGSIYTILPLVSMLSRLTFSSIADRFQCHKALLFFCVSLAGTALFSLRLVPPSDTKVMAELNCANRSFHVKICSPDTREDRCLVSNIQTEFENSNMYCSMKCNAKPIVIEELCTKLRNESKYCGSSFSKASSNNKFIEYKHKYEYDFTTVEESVEETTTIVLDSRLMVENIKEVDECLLFSIDKIKDSSINEIWQEPHCDASLQANCYILCNSSILMNTGEISEVGAFNVNKEYWMLLLILIASHLGIGAISCLGDTICYSLLGDSRSKYGKQRLWGSLGWGSMAFLSGVLVDNFSEDQTKKDYSPIFYAVIFFFVLDLLMISHMENIKNVRTSRMMLDFGQVLSNFNVIIFIFWAISLGFLISIANSFLFWHLEDLAECSDQERIKTLQGMYITVVCFCGEMPFFFMNSFIMKRFGHERIMSLLLFIMGFMYLLYSVIDNPWWFVPVGILHGLLYSTYYSTMTSYASRVCTPGTEACVQGLFVSAYDGLGGTSGNFSAGLLFYYMDRKTVFRFYSCTSLILSFLFMCTNYLASCYNKEKDKKKDASASNLQT